MDFLGLRTHNISILAIPAYYALAVMPHAYAISIATHGQPTQWDNRCPRSTGLKSRLESSLSPADYARYERAEAASANAYENMPLFVAAVVVGNGAGLRQHGWDGLNGFVATWFGLRIVHAVSYIWLSDRQAASWVRSAAWAASVVAAARVLVRAARVLGPSKV